MRALALPLAALALAGCVGVGGNPRRTVTRVVPAQPHTRTCFVFNLDCLGANFGAGFRGG